MVACLEIRNPEAMQEGLSIKDITNAYAYIVSLQATTKRSRTPRGEKDGTIA